VYITHGIIELEYIADYPRHICISLLYRRFKFLNLLRQTETQTSVFGTSFQFFKAPFSVVGRFIYTGDVGPLERSTTRISVLETQI
jgi:hypothetical protein